MVQAGFAEEEKDNIMTFAGFLFLGYFDVRITVGDGIDFDLAAIRPTKLSCRPS
jgi:hypothetical protein